MSSAIVHNPFATRFTRPGEIPFIFPPDINLQSVVESFRQNQFMAQIVGPHGCGKTTLTRAIESALSSTFPNVHHVTIRATGAVDSRQLGMTNRRGQLTILDGFERVSPLNRWFLIRAFRQTQKRFGSGLLVTTHRRSRLLPVLVRLTPQLTTLRQIAEHLSPPTDWDEVNLNTILTKADGNMREALMLLYDRFESQRDA